MGPDKYIIHLFTRVQRFTLYRPARSGASFGSVEPITVMNEFRPLVTMITTLDRLGNKRRPMALKQMPSPFEVPRILVVDDSTAVRRGLSKLLEPLGAESLEAADGGYGFDLAIRTSIDLVISDVDMPGLDGIELCRRLKANTATRALPVILHSSFSAESDIERGFKAGATILASIESLTDIRNIVLSHHERPDGKGYPNGLSGNRIPLTARMTAVADTFHALTSDRPYRKGMPLGKALDIIDDARETQLCPDCVDLFLAYLEKEECRGHEG